MFAATYPGRTLAVAFWSGQTCGGVQADYPWRVEAAETESFHRLIADTWGDADPVGPLLVEAGIESIADGSGRADAMGAHDANAASRGDALVHERMFDQTDFRSILPAIHVPTVILQPAWEDDGLVQGEWMASQIQGSRMVPLPRQIDFPPYMGETAANLSAIRDFLADLHSTKAEFDRVLATVIFTDIVDSTAQGAAMGDRAWRDIRERHDEIVRANLARFRGREIKTMGDGFLATFDGPARGVRCAQAIATGVEPLGIEIRAGLHTGGVAIEGDDVSGVGVAIGARVGAKASASEVLVSQTVKDLVTGSGLVFEDAGEHELKGVPGHSRLYRVV